jgi:glc operon protein GlcG
MRRSLMILGFVLLATRPLTAQFGESSISDEARLFSDEARGKALEILRGELRRSNIFAWIETVESLGGRSVEAAAREAAQRRGGAGVLVLIAEREHKIDVIVPPQLQGRIDESDRVAIQNAFIDGLKEGEPDRALRDGLRKLAEVAQARPARADGAGSAVARGQIRLQLSGAETILAAARAKAAEMGLKVNIAIVDDGGHLLAFARMDGARPASAYTAITKATTAATFRQETGPLPRGATDPDPLLNLSLQNAAAASGGKLTTLYGGVPVVVEGQVIGGVGVGGGTGEQDAEIARAGIAALGRAIEGGSPPGETNRPAKPRP